MTTNLTLMGLSGDGSRLLLVDRAGSEFSLPVDAKLRAALRGEHARLGQLEIEMDSSLRPRDIQARIRAGETPERVAQAAQTTVEKIMAFAGPVLAERAHVASRAQRASVRRRGGDVGARTLGEALESLLRPLNVAPDSVEWDAWRREDGKWHLTGDFTAEGRPGQAVFAFELPGNFVIAENDEARWLIGEDPMRPGDAPAAAAKAPRRRLSAVPAEDELPLGDDAIELVREDDAGEAATTEVPVVAAPVADLPAREAPSSRDVGFLDSVFARAEPTPESPVEPETAAPQETESVEETVDDDAHDAPRRRQVRKSRGRASVPSWDDIMFGGGQHE